MSWINLNELRRLITADVKARAEFAGLEGVSVHVNIPAPDNHGQRTIIVTVAASPRVIDDIEAN